MNQTKDIKDMRNRYSQQKRGLKQLVMEIKIYKQKINNKEI